MTKVVTVIQARLGSTRLPGKTILPLWGEPLILRMVERVKRARYAGTVVVATTNRSEDDVIEDMCRFKGVEVYRGEVDDVLDRHYQAAKKYGANVVVKIPSDCPLIDPFIIDRVISAFLDADGRYDYVSNLHPATYPDGNDVEVMSFPALEVAWSNATLKMEREHTTPYLWENPLLFKCENVVWETGEDFSMTHRWTIDYEEDYQLIRNIFDGLYPDNARFAIDDILEFLQKNYPDGDYENKKLSGVNWYRHHLHELKTITPDQTRVIETTL